MTKKTAKNQLTIPKALLDLLPPTDYFDAEVVCDALVLRPVQIVAAVDIDRVRGRLERDGVGPDEIKRAIQWARKKK